MKFDRTINMISRKVEHLGPCICVSFHLHLQLLILAPAKTSVILQPEIVLQAISGLQA